jgi:hypothetical protein
MYSDSVFIRYESAIHSIKINTRTTEKLLSKQVRKSQRLRLKNKDLSSNEKLFEMNQLKFLILELNQAVKFFSFTAQERHQFQKRHDHTSEKIKFEEEII